MKTGLDQGQYRPTTIIIYIYNLYIIYRPI